MRKALAKAKSSADRRGRANSRKATRDWLRKSANIALRILDALDEIHMTQAELANRLNVSRQHISKIIKGQENLTLETIVRIEQVLGVALITIPENAIKRPAMRQKDRNLESLVNQSQESDLGFETQEKIKPIVYQTFKEKQQLEKHLFATMPEDKRKAVAVSLMSVFHKPQRRRRSIRKRQ